MHTLVHRLILAVLLGFFFTAAQAAAPISIEMLIPDAKTGELSGSLSVHLYRQVDGWDPIASQYFQEDEWELGALSADAAGDALWRLSADFTDYEALEPGTKVYAEIVVNGWVIGKRLAALVPGPLLNVEGVIRSGAGGIQYPDDSVQATAGITTETDPTVPAYILDGIQWGEVSGRPAGLDDGDNDTTYSAGTGLDIQTTIIGLLSAYQLPQGCSEQEVATWSGGAWVCGSAPIGGSYWSLTGNAGTTTTNFIGTTDNQALELRVSGARALRLEPGSSSPNVLGGYALNAVTGGAQGVTISGGGRDLAINQVSQGYATISGGAGNTASGYAATISGGESHDASGSYAAIGGGTGNTVSGESAVISGGGTNQALDSYASVGGGQTNIASSLYATISGGVVNTASGPQSTIGGGAENIASDEYATVGGGRGGLAEARYTVIAGGGPADEGNPFSTNNRVTDEYGTIGGGGANVAGDGAGTKSDAAFATVAGGRTNVAESAYAAVGGGFNNFAQGYATTIAGGEGNLTENNYATVSGGTFNTAVSQYTTVSGGRNNTAGNTYATVGGGYANNASGALATVPGGAQNVASGNYSLAAGQGATAAHAGSFVWSDSNTEPFSSTADDQFLVRAAGGVGIGTDSPSGALHVVGNTTIKGNAHVLGEDDLVFSGSVNSLVPGCNTADPPAVVSCLQKSTAIAVAGNTAFVVAYAANTVAAFDVTDPQSMHVKGVATNELAGPSSVVAAGGHVYVASELNNRLVVFEATSDSWGSASSAELPGEPQDVFVSGNYAYLAGSKTPPLLAVVDVSNPSRPIVRSSIPEGGKSIHVSGGRAYVAAPTGLTVYDVSDPDELVLIGSTSDLASSPSAIHVSGNRAYVTMESSNSLVVYDISNPAAPVTLGSSPTGSLERPVSVVVSGDHAFVASEGQATSAENNGVVVLDISDPASIEVRGTTVEEGQQVGAIAMAGKNVFVTSRCTREDCLLPSEEGIVFDDRFVIYEFNHLQAPTLQAGNVQAGYLDVVDSASVANGLSVGGGLNVGQAHVGGDLGLGGDLRMLGSIGGVDDVVCTDSTDTECLAWTHPLLTFTNDINLGGHRIIGGVDWHCTQGQYLAEPGWECCGVRHSGGHPAYCFPGITPVDTGPQGMVAVDGDLVPACDAGAPCPRGESDFTYNLGKPDLRWNEVWAYNGLIQTSDARRKTNIEEIASGLAAIERLRPVTFHWKNQADAERHYGLIAQEVAEVLPDLVTGDPDSDVPMAMNYVELVPILIRAIQEQQDQLSDQTSTIKSLQQRLDLLEKRD